LGEKLTTYASKINTRASFTKRTQSLTKINSLGFGVIYYWHWGWSFSPYEVYDEKEKKKLKQAASDNSIPYNTNPDQQKSGRFMYLGLAVQLPTMVRIKAHLDQAKQSNPNNTKALALAQGIKQELTTSGPEGIISDPEAIPHIIHICSLFDLAPLESYYVSTYKLEQSGKGRSFLDIIQNGTKASVPGGGNTLGVNTEAEGSETAGQGSPIRQGDVRGTPEWIMAAYWFLSEQDATVLAARASNPYNFNVIQEKASLEKTLTKKILKVFKLFGQHAQVSSNVQNKFNSITEDQIAGVLAIMGVKESEKLDGLKSKDFITDEKELAKNFSIDKFFDRGVGLQLETLISFDIGVGRKGLTKSQKFLLTKDKVATELRTVLVDFLLGLGRADFGPKIADQVIANLNINLANGIDKMQQDTLELINKAQQITKQSIQTKNKYDREFKKILRLNNGLEKVIADAMDELNDLMRNALSSVAYEAGVKGLDGALAQIPISNAKRKGITGLAISKAKNETKRKNDIVIKDSLDVFKKVYFAFQQLQSALNRVNEIQAEDIEKLLRGGNINKA